MRTGKGKKRKPIGKLTDKKQSEGFIRGAKALGVDEDGKHFKEAMDAMLRKKPKDGNS